MRACASVAHLMALDSAFLALNSSKNISCACASISVSSSAQQSPDRSMLRGVSVLSTTSSLKYLKMPEDRLWYFQFGPLTA